MVKPGGKSSSHPVNLPGTQLLMQLVHLIFTIDWLINVECDSYIVAAFDVI